MLADYAERLIEASKMTLLRGEEVLALFVTINPTGGASLYGLAGDLSQSARVIFRQQTAAKDNAIATLMFGDANIRDETGKIVGETLDAMIEARNGGRLAISCRYRRDPFVFEELQTTTDFFNVAGDTFPSPAQKSH